MKPAQRWLFLGAGVVLACALPALLLLAYKVSPLVMNPESVGRRFFFSYRMLFGGERHVFLPQGQTINLVAHAFNALMFLAAGPAASHLRWSLDIFSYGSQRRIWRYSGAR